MLYQKVDLGWIFIWENRIVKSQLIRLEIETKTSKIQKNKSLRFMWTIPRREPIYSIFNLKYPGRNASNARFQSFIFK